jgi:hypothetical protein
MLIRLRREYGRFITSGGQLLLIGIGAQIDTPQAWQICGGLVAAVSMLAWTSTWRRARAFDDTPTSKVASAAQGYAELQGQGRPLAGTPLLAALSHLPCLWYRYRIERRRDNKWEHEESGESEVSFILDDGSGICVIDPEGAEVLPVHKDTWTQGDHRHTEWRLLENEPLYALGEFHTVGSQDLQLDRAADIKALLAEWKTQPLALQRFDLDGNGTLDMREWQLARAQARREVDHQHREAQRQPELHVMRRPADNRIYMISSLPPERLARRYRLWSVFHLVVFFGALAFVAGSMVTQT